MAGILSKLFGKEEKKQEEVKKPEITAEEAERRLRQMVATMPAEELSKKVTGALESMIKEQKKE